MAAHSNRWLLRGKWVAGQSVRCCFPVFGKELTVSFALAFSAPAKKLKVNLTLPLEVDQTTTMYSWREPSTIAILFCCQAWIGADYEKRALFFFMSSRDRVAMATLVLDLRMHPFVVPTTIFSDVTHRGLVLALWHVRESEDIAILGSIWWPSPTDFKVAAT